MKAQALKGTIDNLGFKAGTESPPVSSYDDILINRFQILKDTKDKSGIYRWINKKDHKSYIGSASILRRRLKWYLSKKRLENYNSRISRALLKYGYSNFRLEILEYCNREILLKREQYYLDNFKPEYNILKIAGSSLGFKHSPETLIRFKNRKTYVGIATTVINKKDNSILEFKSKSEAAKYLNISKTTLIDYANINKLIYGTYLIINHEAINTDLVNPYTKVAGRSSNFGFTPGESCIHIHDNSNNLTSEFSSKRSLAKYLSIEFNVIISVTTISRYIESGKLYKNKYKIWVPLS